MRILESVKLWFRALLTRERVESEMEKEMRLHLELETENNIRLGMTPAEAKRAAMIVFGGVERAKEYVRDQRLTRWLEEIGGDLRLALRGFRRQPAFAIGVIALTALGIGPNAAIFSIVNHLLIAPLPFRDGGRMVTLNATYGGHRIIALRTRKDVELWRRRARAVEAITLVASAQYALGDSTRGPTERIGGVAIGPSAIDFVGMHPVIGHDIEASDTVAAAPPVVLISYALWQRDYAGRADALGKTITLNQLAYTVIGVMPEKFSVPFEGRTQQLYPVFRGLGADNPIGAIAKLRRGSTVEDANRELASIFSHLDPTKSEDAPWVERAVDQVSPSVKRTVYLLFGAVGLVLLIASANVANLMVARAWTRQREFTIRSAMGARRGRLVRQVLVESLTLSLCGGAIGIAVAYATLALMSKASVLSRQVAGARIDGTVLVWVFALSAITGVLFGLAPALFVSSDRASDALKAGNRSVAGSRSSRRLRGALVIGEVALSATLLVASGLLVRTIDAMQHADIGFQPAGLYGVQMQFADASFADSSARHAAISVALDRVRAVPGVQKATLAMSLLPDFVIGVGQLEIDGATVSAGDSLATTNVAGGWPELFDVVGIRILQGRSFARYAALTGRVDPTEVVVNERFARQFFPSGGAIGGRVRRAGGPWATIVGIASDISVPGAGREKNGPQFYSALGASPRNPVLVFRSDIPFTRILPSVTAAITSSNPLIKTGRARVSDDAVAGSRETQLFTLRLIGAFAALALVLAAVGLHATISYSVGTRTREMGIRLALGAQSQNLMELIVGQGIKLTLAGVLLGALGGFFAGRTMRALLYQVAPADPVTILVVGALLIAVAIVASYAPARRAVRVDPAETLRVE